MQTEKLINSLTGQSHILGKWWGNLQTIAQNTNIYIQFLILSFSGTAAYGVLATALHQWGYQLPFWLFVVFVLGSLVVLGLFVWRLSIPSTFASWNYQWWHHGNFAKPIIEKLQSDNEQFKKDNEEMKRELQSIKALLIQTVQEKMKVD